MLFDLQGHLIINESSRLEAEVCFRRSRKLRLLTPGTVFCVTYDALNCWMLNRLQKDLNSIATVHNMAPLATPTFPSWAIDIPGNMSQIMQVWIWQHQSSVFFHEMMFSYPTGFSVEECYTILLFIYIYMKYVGTYSINFHRSEKVNHTLHPCDSFAHCPHVYFFVGLS